MKRSSPGKYQIISGERRYKACRLAGMSTIPAYIRDTDDQGMLEMAIVENVQRENLDPIELALSYQRLIDECNLTQDKLADKWNNTTGKEKKIKIVAEGKFIGQLVDGNGNMLHEFDGFVEPVTEPINLSSNMALKNLMEGFDENFYMDYQDADVPLSRLA